MSDKDTLINTVLNRQNNITDLRKRERQVNKLESSVNSLQVAPKNELENYLEGILTPELMPSNVGDIQRIQWGFFHKLEFDFGTDPEFDFNTRMSKILKVTSDAAFLITRIYRNVDDGGESGHEAPLQFTISDLQSSRQLMDKPLPLQAIPGQGKFFELPVPFLLYPSSSAQVEMKCWLPSSISALATTGSGLQTLVFYGAKVRASDVKQLARTLLKK